MPRLRIDETLLSAQYRCLQEGKYFGKETATSLEPTSCSLTVKMFFVLHSLL